jgi:hypothetical protein
MPDESALLLTRYFADQMCRDGTDRLFASGDLLISIAAMHVTKHSTPPPSWMNAFHAVCPVRVTPSLICD